MQINLRNKIISGFMPHFDSAMGDLICEVTLYSIVQLEMREQRTRWCDSSKVLTSDVVTEYA